VNLALKIAGAFHPPNADATHEVIGQAWLGLLGKV
jgi:hypothetical protein